MEDLLIVVIVLACVLGFVLAIGVALIVIYRERFWKEQELLRKQLAVAHAAVERANMEAKNATNDGAGQKKRWKDSPEASRRGDALNQSRDSDALNSSDIIVDVEGAQRAAAAAVSAADAAAIGAGATAGAASAGFSHDAPANNNNNNYQPPPPMDWQPVSSRVRQAPSMGQSLDQTAPYDPRQSVRGSQRDFDERLRQSHSSMRQQQPPRQNNRPYPPQQSPPRGRGPQIPDWTPPQWGGGNTNNNSGYSQQSRYADNYNNGNNNNNNNYYQDSYREPANGNRHYGEEVM